MALALFLTEIQKPSHYLRFVILIFREAKNYTERHVWFNTDLQTTNKWDKTVTVTVTVTLLALLFRQLFWRVSAVITTVKKKKKKNSTIIIIIMWIAMNEENSIRHKGQQNINSVSILKYFYSNRV